MKKLAAITVFLIIAAITGLGPGLARQTTDNLYTKTITADFEDIFADLQDVIVNEGLVIDFIGNMDAMLIRTSSAAQSITPSGHKSPYLHAKYLQFCSAKLTHKAVSADPQNIAICPYIYFVYETRSNPGKITVGFRPPIFGPSKRSTKIRSEALEFLQDIVDKTVSE